MIETVKLLLSFLTLITGIGLVLLIIYLIIIHLAKKKKLIQITNHLAHKNGGKIILLVSLVATMGSLFFSEIAGYNPCTLCWYQRIMMYPLVIISAAMIIRKTKDYLYAIAPMALIGLGISGYHYYIQFLPAVLSCIAGGVNCAAKEFLTYGYITIPMMALTAFAAILTVSLIMIFSKKN